MKRREERGAKRREKESNEEGEGGERKGRGMERRGKGKTEEEWKEAMNKEEEKGEWYISSDKTAGEKRAV